MTTEVTVSPEKIVMFFGVIVSLLLTLIAFFLRLLVAEFQDFKKDVTNLKVDVAKLQEKVFHK